MRDGSIIWFFGKTKGNRAGVIFFFFLTHGDLLVVALVGCIALLDLVGWLWLPPLF